MWVVVWGLALGGALVAASPGAADVYLYRDHLGVMHFTNAPADGTARMVIKDRPVPRSLRILRGDPGPVDTAPRPTRFDALIREIAARYGVEYALVKAVIRAESNFDPFAVSPKGALGLMQLMPETAALHGVRDVFRPRDNIDGGCRHLRMLLDRYRGNLPLVLAAYNAGAGRVEDAGGVPAIPETREYLARVLRNRVAYMREGERVLQVRR